jgi:hypothetical protein
MVHMVKCQALVHVHLVPSHSTASHAVDVACSILKKLEADLWGQGLVSISVQSLAMFLTSLLPDILIVAITVFQIWKEKTLCTISGNNDSRKRHEIRLISKLGAVHPYGINECFPIFYSICVCLSKADIIVSTKL